MAEEKTKLKKGEKRYLADKRAKYTANVPLFKIVEGEWEPTIRQDKYGREMIDKSGVPLQVMKRIPFNTVVGNAKLGTYCEKITSDPVEIKGLNKLVADGTTAVCTEGTFKKRRNAKAYELELKLEASEKELKEAKAKSEADAAASIEKDKTIAAYKEQVAKLTGKKEPEKAKEPEKKG
jgi:hypothetical protein